MDLLFGIPERTTDDFVHAKSELRIGARLSSSDGRVLEVVRKKGRKDTLLDASGRPLGEASLEAMLAGMDRERFMATFGLNHERLRRGAEDLLAAGGALGEALFDAASGMRSVGSVLRELDTEAERIFAPKASTRVLNDRIASYEGALRRSTEILRAEKFHELERRCDALATEIRHRDQVLESLRAERSKLERIQRNLPRVAQRERLLRELASLGDVPDLPDEAPRERAAVAAEVHRLGVDVQRVEGHEQHLVRELEALDVPSDLLAHADAIVELWQRAGTIRKAAQDLPRQREELAQKRAVVAQLLDAARPGLTIEEAAALRPAAPREKRIAELAKEGALVDERLRTARESRDEVERQLATLEQQLEKLPAPRDLDRLAQVVAEIDRHGDLEAQIAEREARVASARRARDGLLTSLSGWAGSADDLARLSVPLVETVRQFDERLRGGAQQVDRARERVAEQDAELEKLDEQRATLRLAGDVPSIAQRDDARARRDRAWRLVRRAYVDGAEDVGREVAELGASAPLPEAFEQYVRLADEIADRLHSDADRVARDAELERRQAVVRERLEKRRTELAQAVAAMDAARGEWRSCWPDLGFDVRSPGEMLEWLDHRRRVLEAIEVVRVEEDARDRLLATRDRAAHDLQQALASHGVDHRSDGSLATLLQDARRAIERNVELERRRGQVERLVEQRRADLTAAEGALSDAGRRSADWVTAWRAAIEPLGLGFEASRTEVEEFLHRLREAITHQEGVSAQARRIEAIEADRLRFEADVALVVERVDRELASTDPQIAVRTLHERLTEARRQQTLRDEWTRQLDDDRAKLASLRIELERAEQRLAAILRRACASSVDEAEQIEQRCARKKECADELRRIEDDLAADAAGQSIDELVAEVASCDADALSARHESLGVRIEEEASARDASVAARAGALRDLDDLRRRHAEAAGAAQEAAEALAVVRRKAWEYARLRLSATVLREFMERYRQRHEEPLLERGRELFRALTASSFADLRTDVDENDQRILLGITPSGEPKRVEAMSDGTRDQLYLALRIATIEQHVSRSEPLPFIADDLLVNFDDERARAALRALAELSAKTQVLFFTHHQHLVELAREVVPESALGVQELTRSGARRTREPSVSWESAYGT